MVGGTQVEGPACAHTGEASGTTSMKGRAGCKGKAGLGNPEHLA